jgi:hypothetical protein
MKLLKYNLYISNITTSLMSQQETPSKAWYLVPIFFSILGGIVMYLGVKDRSPEMGRKGLIVGILMTVIPIIVYFVILSAIAILS